MDQLVWKVVKAIPEVGKAWKDLEQSIIDSLKASYEFRKKRGTDTSDLESIAKKMGIKLE